MNTLASSWRRTKPADFADTDEYMRMLLEHDPDVAFEMIDGEPCVVFSDGSIHYPRRSLN